VVTNRCVERPNASGDSAKVLLRPRCSALAAQPRVMGPRGHYSMGKATMTLLKEENSLTETMKMLI